jgi:probable HAF family extracellular repeat protein
MTPFLWQHGKMFNLGTLGGDFGEVRALNNWGQVTGYSNLAGNETAHPFLWDGRMRDLGTLGGSFGVGLWMNDIGEVVGFANLQGDEGGHAFRWKKGKTEDLGVLNNDPCSVPLNINLESQIVGASTDCGEEETQAARPARLGMPSGWG